MHPHVDPRGAHVRGPNETELTIRVRTDSFFFTLFCRLIKSAGIVERGDMKVSLKPECTEVEKSPLCFKGNFMGAQKNLQYSV